MTYIMLESFELVNGFFIICMVIVFFAVGISIAVKYFKHKQKLLLYIGIGWCGMAITYFFNVVMFLMFVTTGDIIDPSIQFIGLTLTPYFMFLWLIGITELLIKEKQKIILISWSIFGAFIEIFFIYFLISDPSEIGDLKPPNDVEFTDFTIAYLMTVLVIILITGISFGYQGLKSDNPETKLKGKFLSIAFCSYVLGSILEVFSTISIIVLVLGRIIVMSSAVEFYIGTILPERIKKILKKNF